MEKNKRTFSQSDIYDFEDAAYVEMDSPDLLEDKIKVTGENGRLTVENLTKENLGMVYVRYKYLFTDGTYQGGITYETKFESVGPNDIVPVSYTHLDVYKRQKVGIALFLNFALGMQSLRETIILNIPLIIVAIYQIKSGEYKNCRTFPIIALVANVCGVILSLLHI